MKNILSPPVRKKTYAVLRVVSGSRFEAEALVTGLTHLFAKRTQHLFQKDREYSLSLKFC